MSRSDIIKTGIFYNGQEVEVTIGFRVYRFTKIDGYSWRVYDGVEDYFNIKPGIFATVEEATESARKTVEYWIERDRRAEVDLAEHRRLLKKVFQSKERAIKAGINNPNGYICHECGAVFWALYRSHYSPAPKCPICEVQDWYMIDYYFPKENADGKVT